MRRLVRPSLTPPTLQPAGKGGKLAARNEAKYQQGKGSAFSFTGHWTAPDVRGALVAFHGRVCAYCQSQLPHAAPGDVEHFRPKSHYWWLAYEFGNYFLGCALCNQVFKRELFPLAAEAVPCTWETRQALGAEPHLVLHPEQDPVEDWLAVDWENPLCQVRPDHALPEGSAELERCSTTIDFYRLNLDVQLIRERLAIVNGALDALPGALAGDGQKLRQVRRLASRFQPHGVAIRRLLAELAPHLLSTAEEDLADFLADLLQELAVADHVLLENPSNKSAARFRQEVLWALAVSWKHPPPPIDQDVVEAKLKAAGRDQEVAPLLAKL